MDLKNLRKRFPVFTYENYEWKRDRQDLVAMFRMGNAAFIFNPQVRILGGASRTQKVPKAVIDNFVFHLGLVEVFSYWKAFCSPKIVINAGYLNEYQLAWWKDLLLKGMGQYFYENGIDFREKEFIVISTGLPAEASAKAGPASARVAGGLFFEKSEKNPRTTLALSPVAKTKTLIAVGGGKDSAVTLDHLTRNNSLDSLGVFTLNSSKLPQIDQMIKISGIKDVIGVERRIDTQLLELNKKGYLNGHTPFSAFLAFLSIFTAKLFNFDEVVFSNERSSNEGNLAYFGTEINHQYSKTLEFENKFREYNNRYLSDVNYFSFLRPLYELQILKIFSGLEKYFTSFLSCNQSVFLGSEATPESDFGQARMTNVWWCGKCAKCLASFVGLNPFVSAEKMLQIFGRNLFNEKNLIPITEEILGLGKKKPFECVGTVEETKIAFYLSCKKTTNPRSLPLLKLFIDEVMGKEKNWEKRSKVILNSWDENHNLPERYKSILKKN